MPGEDRSGGAGNGWHQQDIQAEIRKRGSTLAQLSRENGLNRGTLQTAFYKRYPKGQAIIAKFLGRHLHELWPNWYDEQDRPRRLQGRPQFGPGGRTGEAA